MNTMQMNAAFAGKVRRGIFGPAVRRLPADAQEDRLAEATAMTWEMYTRYVNRGVLLDDAILVHSARQRAHDLRRQFVPADGCHRARDTYDKRNYLEGRVELYRINDVDEDDDQWLLGCATYLAMDPTETIVSALDLRRWLANLDDPDVIMLGMRCAGCTLESIADEVGLSVSSVFSKLKRLGTELRERIGRPGRSA